MKEKYLEVQTYPTAKLSISKVALPQLLSDGASFESLPFTGILALHGVERPVMGSVHIERKSGRISIDAQFSLKIKDYSIVLPSFAGVTVADEVQIAVRAHGNAPSVQKLEF